MLFIINIILGITSIPQEERVIGFAADNLHTKRCFLVHNVADKQSHSNRSGVFKADKTPKTGFCNTSSQPALKPVFNSSSNFTRFYINFIEELALKPSVCVGYGRYIRNHRKRADCVGVKYG